VLQDLCWRLSLHSMLRVLVWIMLVFRLKVAVDSVSSGAE